MLAGLSPPLLPYARAHTRRDIHANRPRRVLILPDSFFSKSLAAETVARRCRSRSPQLHPNLDVLGLSTGATHSQQQTARSSTHTAGVRKSEQLAHCLLEIRAHVRAAGKESTEEHPDERWRPRRNQVRSQQQQQQQSVFTWLATSKLREPRPGWFPTGDHMCCAGGTAFFSLRVFRSHKTLVESQHLSAASIAQQFSRTRSALVAGCFSRVGNPGRAEEIYGSRENPPTLVNFGPGANRWAESLFCWASAHHHSTAVERRRLLNLPPTAHGGVVHWLGRSVIGDDFVPTMPVAFGDSSKRPRIRQLLLASV